MNAQGFCDAGAELFRLHQHRYQIPNTVYASAFREVSPGVGPWAAGALFEDHDSQLITDLGFRPAEFLGGARGSLIKALTRFHAYHQEIEYIREAQADACLTFSDFSSQPKIRRQISQT